MNYIITELCCTNQIRQTYKGFPVMEQVRLSESPSRKMPEGGTIRTVGATVEERYEERES